MDDDYQKLQYELFSAQKFDPLAEVRLRFRPCPPFSPTLLLRSSLGFILRSFGLLFLFFYLFLDLLVLLEQLLGVFEVHPESVEPVSKQQRYHSQHRHYSDDYPHERVLFLLVNVPSMVVKSALILLFTSWLLKNHNLLRQLQAPNRSWLRYK